MSAQPTEPTDLRTLDHEVARYLDITDELEHLQAELATIKNRLASRGVGTHATTSGVKVSVTAPPRRFNPDRAWTMLNADQQALCLSPDQAKVKAQLSAVLVEQCMDDGTGAPRVTVK